jgi:hypothetical protein
VECPQNYQSLNETATCEIVLRPAVSNTVEGIQDAALPHWLELFEIRTTMIGRDFRIDPGATEAQEQHVRPKKATQAMRKRYR